MIDGLFEMQMWKVWEKHINLFDRCEDVLWKVMEAVFLE